MESKYFITHFICKIVVALIFPLLPILFEFPVSLLQPSLGQASNSLIVSIKTFYQQLSALSLAILASVFLLGQQTQFATYVNISTVSLIFFIILSIIVFHLGLRLVKSRNKNDFSRLVLGFTGFKMMLSVALVFIYQSVMEPTNRWFVIPFLIIYVLYTIFETYFLMRLGRMTN